MVIHERRSLNSGVSDDRFYCIFFSASPILLAIGIPPEVAKNAVRLSVGRYTSREDIDLVVSDLQQAIDSRCKEL